jgi:hypothetical protein
MSWDQTLRTIKCHQGSLEVTCSLESVLPPEIIGSLYEAHNGTSRPGVFRYRFQKTLFVLKELPKKETNEALSKAINRDLLMELPRSQPRLRDAKDQRPPHVGAESSKLERESDSRIRRLSPNPLFQETATHRTQRMTKDSPAWDLSPMSTVNRILSTTKSRCSKIKNGETRNSPH